MGKLVVFLPDGRNVDVKLDRERVTIGRRPDNDVCLPYPAVSGEHAAVVTILADSFLEDLGSTNGTLVNGKPVAKHFLRDRDRIDIGKQKLIYLADESEKLEPDPPEVAHRDVRLLAERVDAARARAALQAAGQDRRPPPPAVDPALAALGAELDAMPESASVDSLLDAPGPGAIGGGAGAGGRDAAAGGAQAESALRRAEPATLASAHGAPAPAPARRIRAGTPAAARAQRTRRRPHRRAGQGRIDHRPPGPRRRRDPPHRGRTAAGAGRGRAGDRQRRARSCRRGSRSRSATGSSSAASRWRSWRLHPDGARGD